MQVRRRGHLLLVSLALAVSQVTAGAQALLRVNDPIPAQPVAAALNAFSRQTGLQIMYMSRVADGVRSSAIPGGLSHEEALRRLLEATELTFEFLNERTVTIVAIERRGAMAPSTHVTSSATAAPDANSYTHLAQAEPTPPSPSSSTAENRRTDPDEDERADLEEIVVTGTHIRGQAPIGTGLISITRQDIEKTGYATTQQVLQSLPQAFQGGANEDTRLGPESFSNFTSASTVNLRGLGSTSTLLLVNGRRVPVAGDNANFYDVSSIPAMAIDRIEVLPDGASALYGSDAIAGVVNILLREDFDGAEARVRYGRVTDGDLEEALGSLVLGTRWDSGRALLSYEYYDRGELGSAERDYTESADLRPLGGDDQRPPVSNPGNLLDPFTGSPAFGIPPGQDGTGLTVDDLLPGVLNLGNTNEGRDLLADQKTNSAFVSVSQDLGDRVTLFAEGRYSEREFQNLLGGANVTLFVPATNPFMVDPFDVGFALVAYSFLDDLGPLRAEGKVETESGVLGGTVQLGGDWQVQVFGSSSREKSRQTTLNNIDFTALSEALADPDPATAFNVFGDGSNTNPATLAAVTAAVNVRTKSDLRSVHAVADGSLFGFAGGEVKLAIGADYREEDFARTITRTRESGRSVVAAFGELSVPLVGASNAAPGLRRLAVSLAGRYEDYDDVGTTTDPKIGAVWTPIDGLNIRGTWGTSFKTPSLRDLDDAVPFTQTFLIGLDDPASPTGSTFAIMKAGNNGDLDVETATNWTLGIDFTPATIPGLSLSATYFDIDFEDRISSPSNILDILVEEEQFSGIIIRDPDPALVTELCNSEPFTGIGQDPEICTFVPIGAVIDARLNNTATTQVDGVDLTVAYALETGSAGRFDFRLNGSYLFGFKEAFSAGSAFVDLADTVGNVIDLRMRNSVTWSNPSGFAASAFVNYADGYTDDVSSPERKIDSWTTVDLQFSYDTGERFGSWLDHTALSLSVQNVFDESPPFVNNRIGVGYDPNNADALDRFIALQLGKSW